MSRTIIDSLRPVAFALRSLAALLLFAVGACAPRGIAVPIRTAIVASPAASTIPPAHAAEIRFGLIGDVTDANVWALFDSKGYSYNSYAIRSGYWPKLYGLSIPDGRFEPRAASGLPSPVQAEGALFTASVALRSDLTWTDGTPFTADDVAFTVNTALSFQLGFDWHSYYDPAMLDHAEALDAHTVKFYFRQSPNVAAWQYGALQGPVVQKKFWSPKIADATALLPPADSQSQMTVLQDRVDQLQKQVQVIIADGLTATGNEAHQLQGTLLRKQGDLDEARNNLSKAEVAVDASLEAARQALYALEAANEPTLGDWMPSGSVNGRRVNSANPSHPFGMPNFERATYASFGDQTSALAALEKGDVDSILALNGLQADHVSQPAPGENIVINRSSSAHFMVINPSRPGLADPILRRALFCAIDRTSFPRAFGVLPLASFILPGDGVWSAPKTSICSEGYDPLTSFDPSKAAAILKTAGYTWTKEPSGEQAGVGLTHPDGTPVAVIALLGPSEQYDSQAVQAGKVVEASARYLGITLTFQPASPADIRFAVFNTRNYDMAILGWRLSAYPGYLCDWFGPGNPFGYQDGQIASACTALGSASDLGIAQAGFVQIQSLLAQNPAFIPLYSGVTADITRRLSYPFDHVLGGLSGLYGAPSLAVPAVP